MKVHFIQQNEWVEPGAYLSWASGRGCKISRTRCWRGEQIPQEAEADMLVVLGGVQSPATTREECPYYDSPGEQRLIRAYLDAGKIVVGSCLGAQLMGDALGASFEHSPEAEVGPVKAWLTEAGRADPFLKAFPDVFDAGAWHHDMPGLTEDAVVLAASEGCPRQIVRFGRYAYAFQTHLEFTHDIVAAGLEVMGGEVDEEGPFVQTAEQLLAYDYTQMNALLSSFLDAVSDDYLAQRAD